MAGIGFELKKLFVGRGAISKIRAYAYAGIVTSGTMILSTILLLGIQYLAGLFGATDREREMLVVLMVYAILFSLILCSILQTLLSRYTADQMYRKATERIMPSLYGGAITLMIPGGLLYGLFLLSAPEIPLLDRLLNWILLMELINVFLQMSYITAAKDYKRILLGFAGGVATVLALGGVLLAAGISPVTAVMAALVCGYGVMLISFNRILLRLFPIGSGSLFAFIESIGKLSDLVLTGFFCTSGAFAHLILMWFSPLSEVTAGFIRHAPMHDNPAFFAFLVSIPTSINFIVSIEVTFYEKYRRYFSAITGGGTLAEIRIARENMSVTLNQELFRLAQIQMFVMVVYAILARFFLQSIGFTKDMISLFQIMCVGYSAYALGNSVMLLQLYFNDRKGALLTSLAFLILNIAGTVLTMNGSPVYYGMGTTVAGVAMYLIGLPRLLVYVNNIDYHMYCGQPVLAVHKVSIWSKWAAHLDMREYAAESNYVKKTKKGDAQG